MFFPIEAEDWSQALGRIRRLRYSRNWKRIGSSDIYWSAPFLAALVDTVDGLLLEEPDQAFELSLQGVLLAARIREADCPGGSELGKRTLKAWAHAVHGSSCRAFERFPEADAAFQKALALTSKKVLSWAAAEVWRRYAALLLLQGSLAALDFANKSLEGYAGFPAAQADSLILRGLIQMHLMADLNEAARDVGKALDLIEPKRSPREARTWSTAIHNLGLICARGPSDLATVSVTLKRLRESAKTLTRHEPFRRMLCLWIQALLLAPLGVSRKSERLLIKASDWMFENGQSWGACLCSVDLALLFWRAFDSAKVSETLAAMGARTEKNDPRLMAYLEKTGALPLFEHPSEESLSALRDALLAYPRQRPSTSQPLGMIEGKISSELPELEPEGIVVGNSPSAEVSSEGEKTPPSAT